MSGKEYSFDEGLNIEIEKKIGMCDIHIQLHTY